MGLYNRCLGLETGNPSAILRGRNEIFLDILLSCGDKKLYSVSSDRILKVWSVTGGEALETFREEGSIKSVAVHGRRIAIGTNRCHLKVQQLGSKEVIFGQNTRPTPLHFSASEEY